MVESGDPRFADLAAQIEAAEAARQQHTAAKPKRRRRLGPLLPAVVRKESGQQGRHYQFCAWASSMTVTSGGQPYRTGSMEQPAPELVYPCMPPCCQCPCV